MIRKQSILLGVVSILTFLSLTTTYADETQITQEDLVVDRAETNIPVNAVVASTFTISLPSSINLVKSETGYSYSSVVGVKGDIGVRSAINVVPDETVTLYDVSKRPENDLSIPESEEQQTYEHKDPVSVIVTQGALSWNWSTLCSKISDSIFVYAESGFHNVILNLSADSMKAGEWQGVLKFEISYEDSKQEPGLYSVNGALIKSWQELKDEGVLTVTDGVLTSGYYYNDEYDYSANTSANILDGVLIVANEVTELGENAFDHCHYLNTVYLPDSVTNINNWSFYECYDLKSVNIPANVNNIGKYSFYRCINLKSIYMPDNVETLGEGAFEECLNLSTAVISDKIDYIASDTFYNCKNLRAITIPDSVEVIGTMAFYKCTGLKSVNIPSNIITIRAYAFDDCTNLESVVIPDTIQGVGRAAFSFVPNIIYNGNIDITDCKALSINGYVDGDLIYSDSSKTKLLACRVTADSVEISDNTTTIGAYAFDSCKNLSEINIPASVTTIEKCAFHMCTGINSLEISNNVTTVEEGAFFMVPNVVYSGELDTSAWEARSVNGFTEGSLVYSDASKTNLLSCSSSVTEVTIPDSVISIEDSAFLDCQNLRTMNIPNSVESIGMNAFEGCSKLRSVILPTNINNIPAGLFTGCVSLESINIPSNVTSIDEFAYSGCFNIKSIEIPEGVTSIGYEAFGECYNLEEISFPSSLVSLDSWVFEYCNKLKLAHFADTNGWKAGSTSLPESDLSDPSAAANCLIGKYYNAGWTKE